MVNMPVDCTYSTRLWCPFATCQRAGALAIPIIAIAICERILSEMFDNVDHRQIEGVSSADANPMER